MSVKEFRKMQAAISRGLPKLNRKARELAREIEKTRKIIRACTKTLRK